MTQNPGAAQTSGAEVVEYSTRSSNKTAIKRVARMVGAGVLSVGMVGVFAFPAYATFEVEGQPDGFAQSTQTLQTNEFEAAALPGTVAPAEVDAAIAEEARVAEERDAALSAREKQASQSLADLMASVSGQGIVAAALAQLGVFQDCTALVENSLRYGLGISVGDLGTQKYDYLALGAVEVSGGAFAPGDILIWPGSHVAVYIGNGQAVHGGWNGNQTVIAPIGTSAGGPSTAVRF